MLAMISQLWPIRLYRSFGCTLRRNSARAMTRLVGCWMVPGEPALISVADHFGRAALLEAAQRDGVDGCAALVQQRDAAAELDHAVIADVDPVVVVARRAADLEVGAGLESPCHAAKLPDDGVCGQGPST